MFLLASGVDTVGVVRMGRGAGSVSHVRVVLIVCVGQLLCCVILWVECLAQSVGTGAGLQDIRYLAASGLVAGLWGGF